MASSDFSIVGSDMLVCTTSNFPGPAPLTSLSREDQNGRSQGAYGYPKLKGLIGQLRQPCCEQISDSASYVYTYVADFVYDNMFPMNDPFSITNTFSALSVLPFGPFHDDDLHDALHSAARASPSMTSTMTSSNAHRSSWRMGVDTAENGTHDELPSGMTLDNHGSPNLKLNIELK